jgi:hypothetical protein
MQKQRGRFLRDLIVVLALKFVLLFTLYWLFFSSGHRPQQGATNTADAVLGRVSEGSPKND